MEKLVCGTCLDAKTTLKCGLCDEPSCKTCSHLLGEDAFSYLPVVPEILTKGVYCHSCYESKIAEQHQEYKKTLREAANVDIYLKDQGKETRWVRRDADPIEIKECEDHDELMMRLAFQAVLGGFTTLVDVDIVGTKVRKGSYQKTSYSGYAMPSKPKESQIMKDKSLRSNPN